MAQPATDSRLQTLLARTGGRADFPAAAEIIQQLHATVQRENCAALDVVRLILKDPGLSSKILRVVNSAYYRQQSESISTVTKAVIILGFETIRDVATGLLLLEELIKRGHTSEFIREGLRRSLYCGLLAQALSAKVGYPTPEEAYLLGLFADWGMLWIAAHFPKDFEKAVVMTRQRGIGIEDAVGEVLGVPPSALAAGILDKWHFPPSFAEFFREPRARERPETTSPEGKLLVLVGLAADFTAPSGEHSTEVGATVLKRFQTYFGLGPEPFLEAARTARDAFKEQAPLFGLGPAADDDDEPRLTSRRAPVATRSPIDLRAALEVVSEITSAILQQGDINNTLSMVLEGVARAGGFPVVFFALRNPARDHLVGRLGYGEDVKPYLHELDLPLRAGAGILADTVLTEKVHVVPDGSPAPQLRSVTSFVSHPLIVRGKAVGVLVCGRTEAPAVAQEDVQLVQLFCQQAGLALDRSAN
ncbi:MAG TPA: HDOD domain-containing protein [Candidatus Binatia bacterium]|nr:HDOD domain-containing protein [Candidatus Binatia bacterium]